MSLTLTSNGKPAEALEADNKAMEILRKLVDANPTVTDLQDDLARNYASIGSLLGQTSKVAEGMKAIESALEIERRLAAQNPSVTKFQYYMAHDHYLIGVMLFNSGRPTEAILAFERAIEIAQKLADANPTVTEFRNVLAESHYKLGNLLSSTGKPAGAMKEYHKALEIQQKLAAENPGVARFQCRLADTHHSIGNRLSEAGKPAEAMKEQQKALEIEQRLVDANPTHLDYQNALARSYNGIGNRLSEAGKPAEAMKAFEAALAIEQKLADRNPSLTVHQDLLASSHHEIGLLLTNSGKANAAMKAYESALAIRRNLASQHPESPEYASNLGGTLNNIATIELNSNHPEQARVKLREAIEWQLKALAANPANPTYRQFLTNHLVNLNKAARSPGDFQGVADGLRELAKKHLESPGFANDLGVTLHNIAMMELREKRFAEGRDRLREAVEWQRKALAANPANPTYRQTLATHLEELARVAAILGSVEESHRARRELEAIQSLDPKIAALDARLAAVLKAEDHPKNNAERLELAARAYAKLLHASSARLFAEAFAADSKLADDCRAGTRYDAACSAALAGIGQSDDVPPPDDTARSRMRRQALDWLKADLAAWARSLEGGTPKDRGLLLQRVTHWKNDSDLAGIRDKQELAKLSEEERTAFKQLWNEVDQLLARATMSK